MKTQPIRRSSLSRWSFRSTVLPPWLFWVVACAVAVVAGIGVAYFGSPDSGTPLETSTPARSAPSVGSSSPNGGPADDPGSQSAGVVTESEESEGSDDSGSVDSDSQNSGGNQSGFAGDVLSEFQGTTVQVLNASNQEEAADLIASRLARRGFTVQAVETARRIYRRTTVFWTPNQGRRAARALAGHFGWRSAPKPDNLTDEIPVHVVVGEDAIGGQDETS